MNNFFKDIFGIESPVAANTKFVNEAQHYRDLFLLKDKGGSQIRAMKEIFPKESSLQSQQTLIVEYEGFSTPLCNYIEQTKSSITLEDNLLGGVIYDCSLSGANTYRFETVEGIDFFWPQLTGKIRIE